jgi:nicotinamidase-related amidase
MPKTALIVTDMISSYDHPDAEKLVASVEERLPQMVDLVERATDEGVHIIYVNDNFGAWNSNREDLVEDALRSEHKALVEPIAPEHDTSFVVKARHSIFFETPLEYLLREDEIERIVLIGQVTEQCILYSALDAYIRHFQVVVPPDAVACIHEDLAKAALRMMELNMDAEIVASGDIDLTPDD